MAMSAAAKKYNLFTPLFKSIANHFKSKRAVVAIISCISGALPIPGRVTVSAGLLNTIAPNDNRRQHYGIIDYLSTHHYYFWSPLEATVIIPMAVLGISYFDFIGYIWPLLAISIFFTMYYIFKVVQENDIVLEFKEAQNQKVEWINFKVLSALSLIIMIGNFVQQYYEYFENVVSTSTLIVAVFVSFIAAIMLGSSGKFAGVVALMSGVFGLEYLSLFFAIDYAGYMLSPTHKCLSISYGVFNTDMKKFYRILGLFCLAVITAGVISTAAKAEELEEVIVTAQPYPQFEVVGEYKQPAWTLTRKFPSTRVYLMTPPNTATYEKWFDIRDRQDGPAQIRMRDEFAFGLGNRMELDLYAHTVYDGPVDDRNFAWRGFSWELRYALADWGKIWGNPTLYFEHKLKNGKQGIEPKLLLGDTIFDNYIWGLNLIYEANIASTKEEQEREYAATFSLAKVITDNFTLGMTTMYRYNDFGDKTEELYLGPNFQYRFNGNAHISVEYMPRVSTHGYDSRSYIIFAWRF